MNLHIVHCTDASALLPSVGLAGVKGGAFTCVGWQVTLHYPI